MNRLHGVFRDHGRKVLSAYIMPGFPSLESTIEVLRSAERAGVDFVELGVPFSDPLADGPVIQKASQEAIGNGVTPSAILGILMEFRKSSPMPIILMGYTNSFLNAAGGDYIRRAGEAGADGVIIPDLSLEESGGIAEEVRKAGLSFIMLIAPTSSDSRISKISDASTDFSYCVSVTGVTGARRDLVSDEVVGFLGRVRRLSKKPFVVGFGISTPEAAREISRHSDGVVVGSALLQQLSAAPRGEEGDFAYRFLAGLRTAIDR